WTYNLVWKLLHNEPVATGLFAENPFPDKPPRFIRAVIYRYKFAEPGNPQHLWWEREPLGLWMPVLSVNDPELIKFLRYERWMK
ncbi:MAG TPA: lipase maturation factor family protein, partial [Mucilaginibacter sp.]|nr:lipase maturation factor family protein [Mucilaginibacter sp.]